MRPLGGALQSVRGAVHNVGELSSPQNLSPPPLALRICHEKTINLNRIERFWRDRHANVTRNRNHTNVIDLCQEVITYIEHTSPWLRESRSPARRKATSRLQTLHFDSYCPFSTGRPQTAQLYAIGVGINFGVWHIAEIAYNAVTQEFRLAVRCARSKKTT